MNTLVATLTITSGQTASNELVSPQLRNARIMTFFAPGTLPEVVTVQVAPTDPAAAGDWKTLQSNGLDVTLAAGKATVVTASPFVSLRLLAGSATAGARSFPIVVGETS